MRRARRTVLAVLVVAVLPAFASSSSAQRLGWWQKYRRPRYVNLLEELYVTPIGSGHFYSSAAAMPLVNPLFSTLRRTLLPTRLHGCEIRSTRFYPLYGSLYAAGDDGILYRFNAWAGLRGLPLASPVGPIGYGPISALGQTSVPRPYYWWWPYPWRPYPWLPTPETTRLFGITGALHRRLVEIDWFTGQGTLRPFNLGVFQGKAIRDIQSLTRTRNGRALIGGTGFGFDGTPGDLFVIDPDTGRATYYLGSLTNYWTGKELINELTGLSWSGTGPGARLWGSLGDGHHSRTGWLIQINLSNMTFAYRGDATTFSNGIDGMAFVP